MIHVAICPKDELGKFWPIAARLLSKAVDRCEGRQTVEDTFKLVASGDCHLWLMAIDGRIVAAGVTEARAYPSRRILNVLFVGGSRMELWLQIFIDHLKRFAAHNNCDGIEMIGRKGWLKTLDRFGFRDQKAVLMELAL